jgi:hypothetical protein
MKKIVLVLAGLIFSSLYQNPLAGAPLSATESCPLIDHLIEINKEWLKQPIDDALFFQEASFKDDEIRIQTHLQWVAHFLRTTEANHWNSEQRQRRFQQLEVLRQYHERALFPKNTYHAKRRPYFIDDYGTACAVGYLAIQDGQAELAARIQKENNYAYIRELPYPALQEWAQYNGLTIDELAWIQPGYQPQPREYAGVGNNEGVEGVILTMLPTEEDDFLYMAGNFSAIDGVAANSIIAWDGQEWHTLGNGVEGTIYAMTRYNNELYLGGDFTLVDDPEYENFAKWDGSQWIGLQQGDMQGTILALHTYGWNQIMVGGDFQKVNNNAMPYLAKYEPLDGEWTNKAIVYVNGQIEEIPGGMSVNGPVRCFAEPVPSQLLVGGDFTQTAPGLDGTGANAFATNYLAYWDGANWASAMEGPNGPAYAIGVHGEHLYIGSTVALDGSDVAVLSFGLWNDLEYQFQPFGDEKIHGFLTVSDEMLVYGGFSYTPGIGNFGTGVAAFQEQMYGAGFSLFDNTVTAIAEFQNKLFFGGTFTSVDQQNFQGLTQLDYLTDTPVVLPETAPVRVFTDGERLILFHEPITQGGTLHLFNMMGQALGQFQVQAGVERSSWAIGALPAGAYVFRVKTDNGFQTGKFVVQR